MAILGAKLPFLSFFTIILILLGVRVSETRSNFHSMSMVKEKNVKGTSTMLIPETFSEPAGSGKAALFFVLAKGNLPHSGPSHRGNNAPHFSVHFYHRSP
ncbi:hypothetical protein Lalb_Chr18g0054781 [Lupinus albus]|uniref:Transmembrane protein n=1 Tax=Lupinus albus TaxID=3870 RepID=A0A6A4NZE2_LUPAL|nr:hypothetical protein Lalb_Chr18g0054781 [Lupinus albus]